MANLSKSQRRAKPVAGAPPKNYLARTAIFASGASNDRTPELRPLAHAKVVVFGLGCVGAPSAIELARAGVAELRLVDHDYLDPATIVRWPRGLALAGLAKVEVMADWIGQEYPHCRVIPFRHRIGGVRRLLNVEPSDTDVLAQALKDVTLIYDATAELGVQHVLTDLAREHGVPYIGVSGTYGGWGGKVFRFDPARRTGGCWWCYQKALTDHQVAEPPSDPAGELQPLGCGDVTFTGAGFDMTTIALTGVRMAISTMCSATDGGYPAIDADVLHVHLRNQSGGVITPQFHEINVPKHPECVSCSV